MKQFTNEVRHKASLPNEPLFRIPAANHAFACYVTSEGTLHGHPNGGIPLSPKDYIIRELTLEAAAKTEEFRVTARRVVGTVLEIPPGEVVFRYRFANEASTAMDILPKVVDIPKSEDIENGKP